MATMLHSQSNQRILSVSMVTVLDSTLTIHVKFDEMGAHSRLECYSWNRQESTGSSIA